MNFLLHRRFAEQELGSVAAGVGAMLPDLWRIADRKVRPQVPPLPARRDQPLIDALADGVQHHLDADAWFHAAPVFREGERRAAEALARIAPEAPRLGLFGHIAWELCLDGALVVRQGLGVTLASLGAAFATVGEDGLAGVADQLHFERAARPESERARFHERMARLAADLTRGQWIAAYTDGEGLVAILDRIRHRIGLPALEPPTARRLRPLLDDLLDEATPALDALAAARATVPSVVA